MWNAMMDTVLCVLCWWYEAWRETLGNFFFSGGYFESSSQFSISCVERKTSLVDWPDCCLTILYFRIQYYRPILQWLCFYYDNSRQHRRKFNGYYCGHRNSNHLSEKGYVSFMSETFICVFTTFLGMSDSFLLSAILCNIFWWALFAAFFLVKPTYTANSCESCYLKCMWRTSGVQARTKHNKLIEKYCRTSQKNQSFYQ